MDGRDGRRAQRGVRIDRHGGTGQARGGGRWNDSNNRTAACVPPSLQARATLVDIDRERGDQCSSTSGEWSRGEVGRLTRHLQREAGARADTTTASHCGTPQVRSQAAPSPSTSDGLAVPLLPDLTGGDAARLALCHGACDGHWKCAWVRLCVSVRVFGRRHVAPRRGPLHERRLAGALRMRSARHDCAHAARAISSRGSSSASSSAPLCTTT